jgi:hypothetical protein
MKKERKTWFITRSRGTGWLPNSWQGWLLVFIWLLIVTGVISWLNLIFENVWIAMALSIVWCSFMLGILSVIAKLKSNQLQGSGAEKT